MKKETVQTTFDGKIHKESSEPCPCVPHGMLKPCQKNIVYGFKKTVSTKLSLFASQTRSSEQGGWFCRLACGK